MFAERLKVKEVDEKNWKPSVNSAIPGSAPVEIF